MGHQRVYTAVDLVEKAIQFEALTPNPALWKEGLLKDNPPRLLRLQQINALCRALFTEKRDDFLGRAKSFLFEPRIPSLKKLLSGAFLKGRDVSAYEQLIKEMKDTVREKEGHLGETGQLTHAHLTEVYQRLLRYKKQLVALEHFNEGEKVKKTVGLRFSVYLTDEVSQAIKLGAQPLDKALALLVDPQSVSLTREELQLHYGYPKEDIKEIDSHFQ